MPRSEKGACRRTWLLATSLNSKSSDGKLLEGCDDCGARALDALAFRWSLIAHPATPFV